MGTVHVLDAVDAPGVARRALQELADAGATDPATGLLTWKGLGRRLEGGRGDVPVWGAVVLVDSSNGVDEALRRLGEELRTRLPRGSEVARLDAEELILVIPGHAAGLVDPTRLVSEIASSSALGELGLPADSVTCCPLAPTTAGGLLAQVRRIQTELLFGDRQPSGRPEPVECDAEGVLDALDRGEFALLYQPVLGPGARVVAAEALLRWRRPDGPVLPSAFLPTFERLGVDLEVGKWVMSRALTDAGTWERSGMGGIPVVVNMTPGQLRSADLSSAVERGLGRSGAAGLIIETTPRSDDVDLRALLAKLRELRDAGARLSLDRVDRSAVSGGLLAALPLVDSVKLDRSVVSDLFGTGRSTAAAVRILAARAGVPLGATGVETAAEMEGLRRLGVSIVQGFRFCPPVDLSELPRRIDRLEAKGPRSSVRAPALPSALAI